MLYAIFYVDCQKWDSLGVSGALVLLKKRLTLRFSIHSFKLISFLTDCCETNILGCESETVDLI